MNKAYRKTIIAGNWKMNLKPSDVGPYADALKAALPPDRSTEIVICAPAIDIPACVQKFRRTRVRVGAQNLYPAASGAYTGELSGPMLADAGCKYVILGHSERRAMGESDAFVRDKVLSALEFDLRPILCLGESLDQREADETQAVLTRQLDAVLSALDAGALKKLVIAYEPIWAIGTGRTATPDQAQEVCGLLRELVRARFGAAAARGISILYGGSMNERNAAELLAMPDIDGGLIGGASLVPDRFLAIVQAANRLLAE